MGSFDSLLYEALSDPKEADYTALRRAYVTSDRYMPWVRDTEGLEELRMRMATGRWDEAFQLANELLETDPLSIDIRFMMSRICIQVSQSFEAKCQRTFANGLVRAILRSGDGRTPDTAIRVLDSRELRLVCESLKLTPIRSELGQHGGRWIDAVRATGPDGELTVYFDVHSPQSWLLKLTGGR